MLAASNQVNVPVVFQSRLTSYSLYSIRLLCGGLSAILIWNLSKVVMQAIIVHTATVNDLPELSRLWHEKMVLLQQFDARFILTPAAIERWPVAVTGWLDDGDCRICVAERYGNALGYAVGWARSAPPGLFSARMGYVTEIVVDAHAHQGGLGRGEAAHRRYAADSRRRDRGAEWFSCLQRTHRASC